MKLITVILAGAGLVFAFQPDSFKTTFAGHYAAEVHTIDEREAFVDAVLGRAARPWYVDRVLGRQIELQVVFFSRESGGTFVTEPKADKPYSIELPTAKCPDGRGNRVRLFIYGVGNDRFGFQSAPNKEYVINGTFDIDDIRTRQDNRGSYCYADLRFAGAGRT